MIQSNRFGRRQVVGSSVDSTIHFQTKGKTFVAQTKQVEDEKRTRIHQLFVLADAQLVEASPIGIRHQLRQIVKDAEANIRAIGAEGGERWKQVCEDLEYATVVNDDDPNGAPENFLRAVDSILNG